MVRPIVGNRDRPCRCSAEIWDSARTWCAQSPRFRARASSVWLPPVRGGSRASRPGGAADAFVGLGVAGRRRRDHLGRQRRRGRGLVPVERVEVIAHGLLVERRWCRARLPLICRPEPRRVRREHLVGDHELPVDHTEFELGVGDDDAPLGRVRRACAIERQRHRATRRSDVGADQVHCLLEGDVLVVESVGRLRGGREHRLGQLLGFAQARRQRGAVHRPGRLVLLPCRARQVAADDTFDGDHLGSPHQHRSTGEPRIARTRREVDEIARHQVVRGDRVGVREPERRHRHQDPALVGHGFGHDDVECRDPIGRHQQEMVVAGVVDVADLARVDQRQVDDAGRWVAHKMGSGS